VFQGQTKKWFSLESISCPTKQSLECVSTGADHVKSNQSMTQPISRLIQLGFASIELDPSGQRQQRQSLSRPPSRPINLTCFFRLISYRACRNRSVGISRVVDLDQSSLDSHRTSPSLYLLFSSLSLSLNAQFSLSITKRRLRNRAFDPNRLCQSSTRTDFL
jgi:hypothetical protein